jgi:hypothetical protein
VRHWHKLFYSDLDLELGRLSDHRNSEAVKTIEAELQDMIDASGVDIIQETDIPIVPFGLKVHALACYVNRAMGRFYEPTHMVGDTDDDYGRARIGLNRVLEALGLAVEVGNAWKGSASQLGHSAYKKVKHEFVRNEITERWLDLVEDDSKKIQLNGGES